MKNAKELLGGRIRELRKGQRMTQEQLSEKIDVDPRYVSRIEIGNCYPSLETLENIARALKVRMKDLFDYDFVEEELNIPDAIEEILNSVEDCQQRKMILRITKAVKAAVINHV